MKNPEYMVDSISSKNDFSIFLSALANDFKKNQHKWENKNLADYFEAISMFVEVFDSYCKNNKIPEIVIEPQHWRAFADILMAGKVYE